MLSSGWTSLCFSFFFFFIQSLLSTTAFGLGAKYFAFYEEVGVGVQWANLNISPLEDDNFSLGHVAAMMLVDAFIYSLLVWYIENVHPGLDLLLPHFLSRLELKQLL